MGEVCLVGEGLVVGVLLVGVVRIIMIFMDFVFISMWMLVVIVGIVHIVWLF